MPHHAFDRSRWTALLVLLVVVILSSCSDDSKDKGAQPLQLTPFSTIYEIYVPHWGRNDQFKAIGDQALRIRNLGVTSVILSPVQDVSELMKLGPLGSPFAIKDHSDIRPMYGTPETFQAMIDTFHTLGIPVYMDWFPAMVGRDHPMAANTLPQQADSVLQNPMQLALKDVLVPDYSRSETMEAMCKSMSDFVKTYGLDGLRVFHDPVVPESLYDCFTKATRAEVITAWAQPKDFRPTAMMNDEIFFLLPNAIRSVTARDSLIDILTSPPDEQMMSINGISNYFVQDERGGVYNTYGYAYKCMSVMAYMANGLPMIEAGMELPVMRNLSIVLNIEIPWRDNMDDDFYRQLNLLVRRNRALHAVKDVNIRIIPNDNENVIAIERTQGTHKVVGIFNLSEKTENVSFKENVFNLNEHARQTPVTIRKGEPFKMAPYLYILLTNV